MQKKDTTEPEYFYSYIINSIKSNFSANEINTFGRWRAVCIKELELQPIGCITLNMIW